MSKLGIVCSTGGGAFLSALKILRQLGRSPECVVITDRECGVETHCDKLKIPYLRIESTDKNQFSQLAANWLFDVQGVNWVCMFFSRLVSAELYEKGPCINIHPSLLPAFPGMGAFRQAWQSNALFHGATAHLTNEVTDGGPILAQVCAPINRKDSERQAERVSFALKVYLLLLMWEVADAGELESPLVMANRPVHAWANPGLRDPEVSQAFEGFLQTEGIQWIR